MKLIYRLSLRISLALLVLLAGWSVFFYTAVGDEIEDGIDDALENYSEWIITRTLAGRDTPARLDGFGASYRIEEISEEQARERSEERYVDATAYVAEFDETVPVRTAQIVFRDGEGRCFELTVSLPIPEKDDLQKAMLNWIVMLYAALLFAVILICVWVIQRNMRPLYAMLKWLDHHTVGRPGDVPPHLGTKVTEFRKLNESIVRYTHRAEESFERQKQFTGNASHEMQTPLAVCRNRLELVANDSALSESHLREILQVLRTLENLSRMNKTLLLLSRIDNGQFSGDGPIDLGDILRSRLPDYREIYARRRISVSVEEQAPLRIVMDGTLADILITNLLKNAYVHNRDGGSIRITIDSRNVTFRNTGKNAALDGTKIFDRFYREESQEGSTGLGLALVDSICRQAGLSLDYFFDRGEHVFQVGAKGFPHRQGDAGASERCIQP